jgi:hypothetical protein
MNKQLLTVLSIVVVAAIIAVLAFTVAPRKAATSGAKSAAALEQSGKYDAAMSAYAAALVKLTEGRAFTGIPDKTTAANLNPQTWEKPITDFADWLNVDKKMPPAVSPLMEGLDRCMPQVKYENFVYEVKMKKAALADYKALWQRVFCPEPNCPEAIIEKAFSQSDAIVTLSGNSIYSYSVSLVNRESGKRTDISVEQDVTPSFLAKPGKYCLVVKSTTMFQDKREWISGEEAVSFEIPDSVTVVSALLRTEVGRTRN